MTFHSLMTDVECVGIEPTAPLVSIGAVFFDENAGTLGATFKRNIHLATSVAKGFVMEPAAVLWWLMQPIEIRNEVFMMPEAVDSVMREFAEWIDANGPGRQDIRVFGCSPAFDCIKLAAHFKACGVEAPWLYFNERDYRTIRERNKVVPEDERVGHHSALDDAIHQAKHLIKIRQYHAQKATRA